MGAGTGLDRDGRNALVDPGLRGFATGSPGLREMTGVGVGCRADRRPCIPRRTYEWDAVLPM